MTTLSAHVPSTTTASSKTDVDDFEPDDEWKKELRLGIEDGLKSMVQEAKDNLYAELKKYPVTAEGRKLLDEEYKKAMGVIKDLANEQYQAELHKERNQRRWLSDVPMAPGWSDLILQEQQNIMNSIKQSGDQANSSPGEEIPDEDAVRSTRRSSRHGPFTPDNPTPSPSKSVRERVPFTSKRRTSTAATDDPSGLNRPLNHQEEHERPFLSSQTERRRSDSQNTPHGHEEPSPTFLRQRGPNHERPPPTGAWISTDIVDEPEESPRLPPPRSRQPTGDPPVSSSDRPWDGSLGRSSSSIRSGSDRHSARSPPNTEFRRASVPPPDDVPPPKPYTQVHRRGSTASMRSTGSGASIRPMTETIPERVDDVSEEGPSVRERDHEPEKARKSTDKAREKEKRPHVRRDSRPTPVDPSLRHDDSLASSASMRSTGSSSATMQYATSGSPNKSLSTKSSFVSMEERYHPVDRPAKPAPYADSRDNHLSPRDAAYSHREPYSPRDPPPSATRPPPPRSPYVPDDRDYNAPPRPLPPRSPYNGDDREYAPRDMPPRSNVPRSPYDDRDYPPSRDMPNSASHPPPPRAPYGVDDRDYNGAYQPPNGRHNGSKGAFMNDRDYPPAPHPPISHKGSFTYEDQRRRERDQWERDREPAWHDDRDHRERDRDYNRERDREVYPDQRQPAHFHYSQRAGTYPTPPSSANRHSQEYHDVYDDRDPAPAPPPPSRGYPYRNHSPEEYEYGGRPESTRPSMPVRQPSYTRRDTPDRRLDNEAELYPPRQYTYPPPDSAPRTVPIPHHTPANEDDRPVPAWKEWAAESRPRPPSDRPYDTYGRSPPATDQQFTRHTDRHVKSQRYRHSPPSDPESPHYDDTDPDDPSESDDEDGHGPSFSRSQSETDDGDDADEEDDDSDAHAAHRKMHETSRQIKTQSRELRRLEEEERRAEEKAREKEIEMNRKEEEVRRKEAETKRKEDALKRKEEEARQREEEARQKAEEARLKEEEARQRAEDARLKEEELRRKEEEAQLLEEEVKRKEREAAKKEAEAKKKEQEAKRKEAEVKKKEAEAKRKEKEVNRREQDAAKKAEDARKLEVEAGRKAEEAKRKEAEVKKKEEQTREKEERLKRDAEQTKILQEQAQKIADEAKEKQEMLRLLEEQTRKREEEIREREKSLSIREAELRQREADARKKEEDARRMEQEAQEKEAEAKRKEEEAEVKRKEEEEVKRKAEEVKRKEEEVIRKVQEAARRKEQEEVRRREQEEAKRKEEAIKREEARLAEENSRRESEARRQPELDPLIMDEDLFKNVDPKIIEEQAYILQQFKYRQQAENIRRNRAEQRTRNDSIGNESAWSSSYPSASPGASSSIPRPSSQSSQPQPPQPAQYSAPPTDRNSGASSWSAGGSAWTSSTKTSTAPSSNAPRTPTGPPPKPTTSVPLQPKPRTESSGSNSYPSGASPHAGPGFSENEWSRRHAEFTNSQHEKFRREQEKIEAEIQMRSAGKPLTREDMVRVLERHEKLWSQLSSGSDLTWNDFPWPMARPPLVPDDISAPMISAYMQSPCWPDKERTRTTKDRIKEHMKKWHPDRFETKFLPKVVESQKETVKQGAGNVARHLSDLLRKENENNSSSNLFGE